MKNIYLTTIFTIGLLFFSGEIIAQSQQYTNVGSHSFVPATSVLSVKVECVGGGGGGGRVTPSNVFDNDAAGGGGGAAYASAIVSIDMDSTYLLEVGQGGVNHGSTTYNGGNSLFKSANITYVLAEGGYTRTGNDNEAGADGGKAVNSIGDITYKGGKGGAGDESDADGGGGGGAAGSQGAGYAGSNLTGGAARASYGGYGGNGGADGASGASGGTYGGGGGGSSANGSNDRDGGDGASGIVVVSWSTTTGFSPSQVCNAAGEEITVSGTNYTAVDSVLVGEVSIPFTLVNDSTLTIIVDASIQSAPIAVYTENGASQSLDTLTIIDDSLSLSVSENVLTALYSGTSSATWTWIDCVDNDTISVQADSLVVQEVGLYKVVVEENGCIYETGCETVSEIPTGIEVLPQDIGVIVYPIPVRDLLYIDSDNHYLSSIIVYDLKGQELIKRDINDFSAEIDLSKIATGTYIVKIMTKEKVAIQKIIID